MVVLIRRVLWHTYTEHMGSNPGLMVAHSHRSVFFVYYGVLAVRKLLNEPLFYGQ
jgi:hypothetical protein